MTAELDRLAGADTSLQQKLAAAAWRKPKAARRALLSGLLRLQSHVIVCIRANERTRMAREALAMEPIELGLTPVAAPEFLFELTCSALLKAGAQGVPTWTSSLPGEHAAIKLPRQFENVFSDARPLSERHGEALARWAAGEPATQQPARRSRTTPRRSGPSSIKPARRSQAVPEGAG